MRVTNPVLTMSAALLLTALPLPVRSQGAQDPSMLSGRWRLNSEQSEDARAKLRDAMGGMPGGLDMPGGEGGGGGGGRSGGGGGGRAGGSPGGGDAEGPLRPGTTPGQRRRQREAMQAFVNTPPGFVITMNADILAIIDATGSVLEFRPDGRTVKIDAGGTSIVQKAQWKGRRLTTETRVGEGPKIVVTYELASSGRQLVVTTKTDTPRQTSVSVRRVYDSVEGAG
jgi:hypothetical protein